MVPNFPTANPAASLAISVALNKDLPLAIPEAIYAITVSPAPDTSKTS